MRGLAFLISRHQRIKVLYSILTIVLLHVAEILVFGILFWLLPKWPTQGHITGQDGGSLIDAIYLSAVTFSTVGYGDIAPVGPIRLLAGTEALLGLVLITWSASFTYLEMDRYWRRPLLHAGGTLLTRLTPAAMHYVASGTYAKLHGLVCSLVSHIDYYRGNVMIRVSQAPCTLPARRCRALRISVRLKAATLPSRAPATP